MTAPRSLSFVARLLLAWVSAWRVLFDSTFAARLAALGETEPKLEQDPRPPEAPSKLEAKPEATATREEGAIALLTLFQREGRLVDFLQQDVTAFEDADVGAAARVVHSGCRRVLGAYMKVAPVRSEAEGSKVSVEADEMTSAKLVGSVAGSPPYRGTLRHRGWRVRDLSLPARVGDRDATVVAEAEVEL